MERVTREEMKIKRGEGHLRLLLCIRKESPHAAFDDRRDNTMQARIATTTAAVALHTAIYDRA